MKSVGFEEQKISTEEQKTQETVLKTESKQMEEQQADVNRTLMEQQLAQKKQTGGISAKYGDLNRNDAQAERKNFLVQDEALEKQELEMQNVKMQSEQELRSFYGNMKEAGTGNLAFQGLKRRLRKFLEFAERLNGNSAAPEEIQVLEQEYDERLARIYTDAEAYVEKYKDAKRDSSIRRLNLVRLLLRPVNRAQMASNHMQFLRADRLFLKEDYEGAPVASEVPANVRLTSKEKEAIKFYAKTGVYATNQKGVGLIAYQWVNGILRGVQKGEDLTEIQQKEIAKSVTAIDQAIARSSLKQTTRLYRGADLTPVFGDTVVKNPQSLVGKVISDKGYTSTSSNREVSNRFVNERWQSIEMRQEMLKQYVEAIVEKKELPSYKAPECLMEITARKGAHGLALGSNNEFKEDEILFGRGTRMLIQGVKIETRKFNIERFHVNTYVEEYNTKQTETEKKVTKAQLNAVGANLVIEVQIPVLQVEIR